LVSLVEVLAEWSAFRPGLGTAPLFVTSRKLPASVFVRPTVCLRYPGLVRQSSATASPTRRPRASQGGDNRTEIVVGGVKEALYLVANNSPADPFPRPLGWADSDSDSRLQRIPHWRGGDWTILEMRCSSSRAFYVLRIWGAPRPYQGYPYPVPRLRRYGIRSTGGNGVRVAWSCTDLGTAWLGLALTCRHG
jgi:hypothetical protein